MGASTSRRSAHNGEPRSRAARRAPNFEAGEPLDEDLWGANSPRILELAEDVGRSPEGPARRNLSEAPGLWPTGRTPLPGEFEVETAEVDRLCTWGPTPKSVWQTVPYAIAVVLGRRGLLQQTRLLAHELAQAEKRRDESLAALGEKLLDTAIAEPRLRAAAEDAKAAIAESAEIAKQQDAGCASARAEFAALEQALSNEQSQFQGLDSQRQRCRIEVEQAELNLKREQARLQRLNIERRNLEQSAAMDPELPAKLEALGLQTNSCRPQIEAAERALSAAGAALQHLEASAADSQAHIQELKKLAGTLNRSQSLQLHQVSILAENIEAKKRLALANLGRGVLAGAGRIAVESSTIAELYEHDEEVRRLSLRHQICIGALDNYDRPSVKRGILLIIGAGALFVVGLFARILG